MASPSAPLRQLRSSSHASGPQNSFASILEHDIAAHKAAIAVLNSKLTVIARMHQMLAEYRYQADVPLTRDGFRSLTLFSTK
jgi:hypothetical protein